MMMAKDLDPVSHEGRGERLSFSTEQGFAVPGEGDPLPLGDLQNGMLSNAFAFHALS
jgi:hypothetical protein